MNLIYLALGFALSDFFYTVIAKKLFLKHYRPFDIMRFWMIFTGFVSLIGLFFVGIKINSSFFYFGLIGFTIFTMLGHFFQLKAIKELPISIVAPLGAFFPLIMILVGIVTIREIPTLIGFIGVVLVFVGAYIINIKISQSWFEPLSYLVKDKRVWFKHFANLFWAFAAVFLKISLNNSELFSGIFILSVTVGIVALTSVSFKPLQKNFLRSKEILMSLGFFRVLQTLFQWILLSVTLLGYGISLSNISLILIIFAGKYYFKERQGWERIIGAIVVYLGIQLILLFG